MSEAEFHDLVRMWLHESFAEVEHEVYLPSGRRPDFVAYTPFDTYVIEVEDTWDTVYRGIGQVSVYATETGYEPVLVFPADAVEDPLFSQLRENPAIPTIETV